MFERYTEKARRAIFFARYEASEIGSPQIETEYLLLGILREDKTLTSRLFKTVGHVETLRTQTKPCNMRFLIQTITFRSVTSLKNRWTCWMRPQPW